MCLQRLGRGGECAGGLGQVVNKQHVGIFHLTDDVGRFRLGGAFSLLRYDGKARAEGMRIR